VSSELYGPVMCCFTLVAVLLYCAKSTGHTVVRVGWRSFRRKSDRDSPCPQSNGTIIGFALARAFGYWATVSGLCLLLGYVFNSSLSLLQLASVTVHGSAAPWRAFCAFIMHLGQGYGLASYCVALVATVLLPQSASTIVFVLVGAGASLRLVRTALPTFCMTRSPGPHTAGKRSIGNPLVAAHAPEETRIHLGRYHRGNPFSQLVVDLQLLSALIM
jgi:hypothetical protein